MTILETEFEVLSFEELRRESNLLRWKLKKLLQEMRKHNESRGHIIELRELLRLAPELLARGVHIGKCANWDQAELAQMGLTGEEFLLKHKKTELVFQLAYAQAIGVRLGGGWDDLIYLLVPHFSKLIRYYRQRADMQ